MKRKVTYREAGVDIDSGKRFVDLIKPLARATHDERVVGGVGGFSGLYSIPKDGFKNPLLVSAADGVGTKLKLAFQLGVLNTIGIDLVAMCVNDVVTSGARPLFFLDYLASGKLDVERSVEVVRGIAEGCKLARCALLGGETAEMPGSYPPGEFDLAGFAVGIVDAEELIDGSGIEPGDRLIGLASSGLHSNGYSLVRRALLDEAGMELAQRPEPLLRTLGEEFLEPTRIYVGAVLGLAGRFTIRGLAHITGGGLIENLARVVPPGCRAEIDSSAWEMPPVFGIVREAASLDWSEMYRTFNCGVGMVVVVSRQAAEGVMEALRSMGEEAWVIGEIKERGSGEPAVAIG